MSHNKPELGIVLEVQPLDVALREAPRQRLSEKGLLTILYGDRPLVA